MRKIIIILLFLIVLSSSCFAIFGFGDDSKKIYTTTIISGLTVQQANGLYCSIGSCSGGNSSGGSCQNGTSINITSVTWNGGIFNMTWSNGYYFTSPNLTGPQGIQGNPGSNGANGAAGINGVNGSFINDTSARLLTLNISTGYISSLYTDGLQLANDRPLMTFLDLNASGDNGRNFAFADHFNTIGKFEFLMSSSSSGVPNQVVWSQVWAAGANDPLTTFTRNVSISKLTATNLVVGSLDGDLNANLGTFFINSTSNRTGIGTTIPDSTLDVHGNINTTSNINLAGNLSVSGRVLSIAGTSGTQTIFSLNNSGWLFINNTNNTGIQTQNISTTGRITATGSINAGTGGMFSPNGYDVGGITWTKSGSSWYSGTAPVLSGGNYGCVASSQTNCYQAYTQGSPSSGSPSVSIDHSSILVRSYLNATASIEYDEIRTKGTPVYNPKSNYSNNIMNDVTYQVMFGQSNASVALADTAMNQGFNITINGTSKLTDIKITGKLDADGLKINTLSISNDTNHGSDRCTLVAGACTISNTAVTANTNIFCQIQANAGTLGSMLYISARVAGTSYSVTDLGGTLDTSTVGCILIEPHSG